MYFVWLQMWSNVRYETYRSIRCVYEVFFILYLGGEDVVAGVEILATGGVVCGCGSLSLTGQPMDAAVRDLEVSKHASNDLLTSPALTVIIHPFNSVAYCRFPIYNLMQSFRCSF